MRPDAEHSVTTSRVAITLAGMRFHVRVGILPHEREHPQPLEIDLSVTRDDDATGVLDYRRLHELASIHTSRAPLDYLEDIATSLVSAACALDGVTHARAAVRK